MGFAALGTGVHRPAQGRRTAYPDGSDEAYDPIVWVVSTYIGFAMGTEQGTYAVGI